MSHQVIGLHIGSLGSVVGRFKDRVVDVVLSDSSNRQVPTVVSYNDRKEENEFINKSEENKEIIIDVKKENEENKNENNY